MQFKDRHLDLLNARMKKLLEEPKKEPEKEASEKDREDKILGLLLSFYSKDGTSLTSLFKPFSTNIISKVEQLSTGDPDQVDITSKMSLLLVHSAIFLIIFLIKTLLFLI